MEWDEEKKGWELHAIIRGRVQGVGFRATTQFHAERRRLTGTVRNLVDGSVEIYAQGNKENLEGLLEDLRQDSGLGSIDSVTKEYSQPRRLFSGFTIIFR